jgi:hypothetical protein
MLISQAYAGLPGGHPMYEGASQSFEANRPVLVHSCCRLGRTANPPSFWLSFPDWLRHGRRR